jgi:formylmethionine deformylase/peptide deformylase
MTVLTVLLEPDPILRQKSKPVQKFDNTLSKFVQDLIETMYKEGGVGIAAIQVGEPIRLLIVDIPINNERNPYIIINPNINYLSEEKIVLNEACLSVKEINGDTPIKGLVERPISIAIGYQDINGENQSLLIDGNLSNYDLWFARCLQHELDHLEGILFIDKLYMDSNISPLE